MSEREQTPLSEGEAGPDYAALLAEGMELVQRLTGRTWTNHNWSDPGVTILQQLCYALTDLAYRSGFSVADLLGDPVTGRVDLRRQALHPARAIMPVNPVTADDFRRLILDRVPDAGNAWFTRVAAAEPRSVDGLYRVQVLIPELDPCCESDRPDPDVVRNEVLAAYAAHRALCEDVDEVVILRPIRTRVFATVQLDDGTDPDRVLADLLFHLRLALAPEPERRSLDQLRVEGLTTAEIFDGPLMLRGFVPVDQLPPLPDRVPVDHLLEVMAEAAGVLSVERLRVEVDGVPYNAGEVIEVPRDHVLLIDDEERRNARSIILRHGSRVCPVDPARVRRWLNRFWADRRRTYDLRTECARDLPVPNGRPIDLSAYTSVQDQFPATYAIGGDGSPTHLPAPRRAMATQLKGYLMVYDQLMADFLAQLAFVRDLFSVDAGGGTTYAAQSLRDIVPDAAPLLAPDYDEGLQALARRYDPVLARQNALLDLLLSLYAEPLSLSADAACGSAPRRPEKRLIAAKKALLARIVRATRDRGRGFDYRAAPIEKTAERVAIRARIELALLDATGEHGGAVAVDDPATASFGRLLPPELGAAAASFLRVDATDSVDDTDEASPLAGHTVAAALLAALADADRYRVGTLPGSASVSLVCIDLEDRCWALGEPRDLTEALALTRRLIRAAAARADLTIVEWTLLRFAEDDEHRTHPVDGRPGPGLDARSRYGFRVSAVMPAGSDDDEGRRSAAIAIVRANMPAHVAVDPLFLHRHAMHHFRRLDAAWRHALRAGDPLPRARACRHLVHFLERPTHASPRYEGGTVADHELAE